MSQMSMSQPSRGPSKRRILRKAYKVSKVPRAIRTRGTPQGYYEIPSRLRAIVGFNRNGFSSTNQTNYEITGNSYRGLGMYWTLAEQVHNYGEGSTSNNQGFAQDGVASLQGVFDTAKIAYLDIEVRFNLEAVAQSTNAAPNWNPSLYLCIDPDDATPPLNLNTVLQYDKVWRLDGNNQLGDRSLKLRVYPKIRRDVGFTADDIGSSTTLVESAPSVYMDLDRPGAAHMGIKGWLDVPGATGAVAPLAYLGYVTFEVKRVVRYKVTK